MDRNVKREMGREREGGKWVRGGGRGQFSNGEVCVCVRERERERESEREIGQLRGEVRKSSESVCVCVWAAGARLPSP